MGATIEIQRSQQAEAIEQQLIRARNRYNVVSWEYWTRFKIVKLWSFLEMRKLFWKETTKWSEMEFKEFERPFKYIWSNLKFLNF